MRTLTKLEEFKKFAKEFGFIDGPLLGLATKEIPCNWKITIKYDVTVADREILFVQPEIPRRWLFSEDLELAGFYYAYIHAYDRNGYFTNYIEYSEDKFIPFLKTVIDKNDIERLVLTRELHWHKRIPRWNNKGLYSPCGDLVNEIYEIHIIKEPIGGFWNLVNTSKLYKNVNITDYQRIKKAAFENNEAEKTIQEMENALEVFYKKTDPFFQKLFSKRPSNKYTKSFPKTELTITTNKNQYFLQISSAYSTLSLILDKLGNKPPEILSMNSTVDFAKTMLRNISDHSSILLIGL